MLFVSLSAGALICKVMHETGHALTAFACGAKIQSISVRLPRRPGLFRVRYSEPGVRWQRGLTALMGTGSTTMLAYALIAFVLRVPCGVWLRLGLASVALVCAWDMFLYATLPLLGLRRFLFFGGQHAEPVEGAEMMGIPRWVFLCALAVSFAVFHALLCAALRRHA